ncbi:hypothetical protein BDZ94DRAFT_1377088, partial [Collybia nuda]
MSTVTEEYERHAMKQKGCKEDTAAFHAGSSSSSGRGHGGSSSSKECFNCRKKGHYKANCWASSGGKEGQGPKGKGKSKGKGKETETAGTAESKLESEDQAWFAKAEGNVLGFIKKGLNTGVVDEDVEEEISGGASQSLTGKLAELDLGGVGQHFVWQVLVHSFINTGFM